MSEAELHSLPIGLYFFSFKTFLKRARLARIRKTLEEELQFIDEDRHSAADNEVRNSNMAFHLKSTKLLF